MRKNTEILIIDGQGGKIGRQLVELVLARHPAASLTAVGTNSIATSAMMKGGAHRAATGENAVIVACRSAGVIIGPLGIVVADSLLGEVSPAMATAVGQANAVRILIPMGRCSNIVAGASGKSASALLEDAMNSLDEVLSREQPL